jgi:hypothetical protein
MHIVRTAAVVCFVLGFAARASADVSCAMASNLCTGNPCETTNITVQSPCVVDFGNTALVIGGNLTVPSGGTLSFTASSITVQGRIEAPGGSVTLVADTAGADLNTEIDVGSGSITVNAVDDIDVKNRLKAKPGGSITVDAGGLLETHLSAVIDVQEGGSVVLGGGLGATIAGRVFAGGDQGGNVQITSSAGIVTLNQDIRADGAVPSTVTLSGAGGVVVNEAIVANHGDPGGSVSLISSGGDVVVNAKVSVAGVNGGSVDVQAPLGTVGPLGFDARGKINGGSVTVQASTIDIPGKIDTKGSNGNGGSIDLTASTLLSLAGSSLRAIGKMNGGQILVQGDAGSGSVSMDGASLTASGAGGNGGSVVISAPAGAVNLLAKTVASTKTGTGGSITVDGVSLTVGPRARFDVRTHGAPGELRLAQSGAGLFLFDAGVEARTDGTIEALAPMGNLTVRGKFRTGGSGCVGFSAGGVLDVSNISADTPVTATCP